MNKLFKLAQAKGKWHKFPSFNLGGGAKLYKNFAQKLLAVSLCMAVVLLGTPLGGQGVHVAAAADPVTAIPVKMFAEPEDLVDANKFSLATADTAKVGKISFGTRPGEVKYYKYDWSTVHSVGAGPITWLIAGSDATDGLVLYSEAPLIGCDALSGATNTSVFQVDINEKTYTAPANSGYGTDGSAQTVYANHWGASNLRTQLTALASNSSYFKSAERGLMATSTVSTLDTKNDNVEYTTTDVLYAPRLKASDYIFLYNTRVTVGGADSLTIDVARWGGRSWLRSPDPSRSSYALDARSGNAVSSFNVDGGRPSISAAFRLALSSVLFTSAASAASFAEGGKFVAISADTPMTLRLNGTASGKPLNGVGVPTVEAGAIKYTAPAGGARLMVLATASDGTTYQYFKEVTGTGSLALSDITSGLPACMAFTARAWLETDDPDGSTLTYATPATGVFAFRTGHALGPVSKLDATCTEPGHEAHYKCSVCGQLFSDAEGTTPTTAAAVSIPEAGHDSSGAWQKDETHHWKVCQNCPATLDKAAHSWDGGTVTTQPTTSATGVKTYTCSVCGQTKPETIPKLDDETGPGDGANPGPKDGPVWGTPDLTVFETFPQYVNEAGRTSRVLESGALDDRGILWLKETSGNASTWYGLDLSTGAFDLDGQTAFYVQWLLPTDPEYNTYYSQLDDAQKTRVDGDRGWIFLIGVEDIYGNKVQPSHPVNVYVQIGAAWNLDQLKAYFISETVDSPVTVEDIRNFPYPEGADEFGMLTLSHFSPYFIFDELTDEEKAALGLPSTGDISTELLISGLAIVLVSSLGVMLRLITSKKKFEE